MACQPTVNGFKCEKGQVITLTSPNDPSNPLTSHTWTIDGVQVSNQAQFTEVYPVAGSHTVTHAGTNACGSGCSQNTQLDIVDSITPPAPAAAAPTSSLPLIAGALFVAGMFGLVLMSKK
jgi:hypothetical protein